MTDLRESLQESLGAAYTLERELGGGGMSRVFVATETALGRRVVVKVLSPELVQGLSAERFAREIKLSAALQDPHIVPVLASGESHGLPYYTMPYVEGESLRARLLRGERLATVEAVGILRDVALALEYAHARGVVHRDIKPENVLLAGRTAVVADFGIAKAVSVARAAAPSGTLTSIGQSLGTPAYMAPEQATGDPTDHRADLYSWGVMAYELLAGHHPFADKTTAQQLMTAHVMEAPKLLADQRPGLPPPIAALVMQCLAKTADDRPQSAADVVRSIDAISTPTSVTGASARQQRGSSSTTTKPAGRRVPAWVVVLVLVAITSGGLGFLAWRRDFATTAVAAGPKRLAVLPFENQGATEDEYFADGVTDEIRGKLSALPGLQVIARGSSAPYKKTTKTPQEIARELGVRYLLTAVVRWEKTTGGASTVHVSPELVDVGTTAGAVPTTKWQRTFDQPLTSVFKVQSDVAGQVATALGVALGAGEQQQLSERPTQNLAAYDAYLKGEDLSDQMNQADPSVLRRAATAYEQAVVLDSTFASAWAQVSRSYSLIYSNGTSDPVMADKALRAANRAVTAAPNHAEGHLALGDYHRAVTHDYQKAREHAEMARKFAPGSAPAMVGVALALQSLGGWTEALTLLREARSIDPRSASTTYRLARALAWTRQYDEAERMADTVKKLSTSNLSYYEAKAISYLGQGNVDQARGELREAMRLVDSDRAVAYFATYYDLYWLLDEPQRQVALRLTPAAYDDDRGAWGLVMTALYRASGDKARSAAYADSARIALQAQVAASSDAQTHVLYGLALAYSGRAEEATREVERGIGVEGRDDSFNGSYFLHQLVRVHLLNGQPDKALDRIERLLQIPYFISPAWLRVDPTFAPLKGNPRFEKLAGGT